MITSSKCSTNVAGEIRATSSVKSRRNHVAVVEVQVEEASDISGCL